MNVCRWRGGCVGVEGWLCVGGEMVVCKWRDGGVQVWWCGGVVLSVGCVMVEC